MPETLASILGAAVSVAAVRGTLVFCAALVVTTLARKLPAETRHVVWLASLASFILIPLAWLAVPALPLETGISRGPVADLRLAVAPVMSRGEYAEALARTSIEPVLTLRGASALARLAPVLVLAWLAGVTALAVRVAVGTVRLRRVVRQAVPDRRVTSAGAELAAVLSVGARVRIVLSARCGMPFSFGVMHPVIVLPRDADAWRPGRLGAVLTHELAHVRRRDVLVQSIAYFVCVVYWFVPLVWLAWAALLGESESCCDQVVVARGFRKAAYARSILEIAKSAVGRTMLPCTSAALNTKRMLADRLRRVFALRPRRRAFGFRDGARVAAVCLCCLLPVLAIFGQAQSQPIPGSDPFFGTWVNTEVDSGERFDIARSVVYSNGRTLEYRHIADTTPVYEEWKTVDKAWVDEKGWHQYRARYVCWLYPSQGGKQGGYARIRISPDGNTREWVFGEYDYPEEIVPMGPCYGIAYRQK